MNINQVISKAWRAKRYRVKKYITVRPLYKRDANGRFTGGYFRKGYIRRVFDKQAPKVSGYELMAENFAANNALLTRLKNIGIIK